MKIVIIEGPDNSGKNTLINWILDNFNEVKVVHCDKPKSKEDPFTEQKTTFLKLANEAIVDYLKDDVDVLIFNRFYQGEYVYGQLYRNGDRGEILKMIHNIESYLKNNIDDKDIFYVQLDCESAQLLHNNDDGKSLSKNDYSLICKEIVLFRHVYDRSTLLNKKKIFINDPQNARHFNDRKKILQEFVEFAFPESLPLLT